MFDTITKGFRQALNRLAGLTELTEANIEPALREEAGRYRALANTVAYPDRDVAAEHAAIARAALGRDAAAATALLAQHYERTGAFVGADLGRRQG